MKKLALLILPLLLITTDSYGQAENYQNVRFDFGFSTVMPMSSRLSGGFGLTLEPKYQMSDKHTIGLRTGFYFMSGNGLDYIDAYDFETTTGSISVGGAINMSVFNEYFLTEGRARPFVGVGLGYYGGGSASVGATVVGGAEADVSANAFASMGVSPTVGFHYGILKITASYHFLFSGTEVNISVEEAGPTGVTSVTSIQNESNNFLEFKLMLGIGGRPKN